MSACKIQYLKSVEVFLVGFQNCFATESFSISYSTSPESVRFYIYSFLVQVGPGLTGFSPWVPDWNKR